VRFLSGYSAVLARHLEADAVVLPLHPDDAARLALALDGGTALLVLRDDVHREEVEAAHQGGYPVLVRRGVDGEARKFPRGSTLGFEVTVEMVKHLICHHDCCPEGPCPADPPALAGKLAKPAVAGVPWEAVLIFSGKGPMAFATGPLPGWVEVDAGAAHVRLSGVPPAPGRLETAVAATDWHGRVVVEPLVVDLG
jgi:hypothetical protein